MGSATQTRHDRNSNEGRRVTASCISCESHVADWEKALERNSAVSAVMPSRTHLHASACQQLEGTNTGAFFWFQYTVRLDLKLDLWSRRSLAHINTANNLSPAAVNKRTAPQPHFKTAASFKIHIGGFHIPDCDLNTSEMYFF